MAVETLFAFPATARQGVADTGNDDDESRLMTQPGGQLVPLPHEICEAAEKIGDLFLLRKSDYDEVYCLVAFTRAEEVLSSEDCSTGWFPFPWDTAEVSSVLRFERVNNTRAASGARPVVKIRRE